MKYPRSEEIKDTENKGQPAFATWDDSEGSKAKAFKEWSGAVEEFRGISRGVEGTNASYSDYRHSRHQDYSDLAPNVSGRPGLTREDYYSFRPSEATAKTIKGAIIQCNDAYNSVGILRNIIDLMGDFACQGIRVVHPNKRIEKFYQNWFKKVNGKDRSERFLNNLYRSANVVVQRQTARISVSLERDMKKSSAKPDLKLVKKKVVKREIPWRYTFLNPVHVEVIGGALASFIGDPVYALRLPDSLRRVIKSPKNDAEKALVAKLPQDIVRAANSKMPYILPQDKISVWYYKKDDWLEWAIPMAFPVMDDLKILEKLKTADMTALDGAISKLRIIKLGDLEHKIVPTRAAAAKLAEILESNVGGGIMDIVWGPDIEIIESDTNIHEFLGEEKYRPHLYNIYSGLGIPPTLTGHFGSAGATNNYISLKTLMQRLQYGRGVLANFWTEEIKMVQEAMGFRLPAKVEFEINVLGDEQSEKALLIQLADRSLISDELLQHRYQHDPEMEKIRINREQRERDSGKMIPKASPYHDPQFGVALKKIVLQSGSVTPGQVGLRLDEVRKDLKMYPKDEGEKPALEMRQQGTGRPVENKKGEPNQGRPKNSKDKKPRKPRTFKPIKKAQLEMWAKKTQTIVAETLTADFLNITKKKDLRSLTREQAKYLEQIKFDVLFGLSPLSLVNEESVVKALSYGSAPKQISGLYKEWQTVLSKEYGRKLNFNELRDMQICLYATIYGEN